MNPMAGWHSGSSSQLSEMASAPCAVGQANTASSATFLNGPNVRVTCRTRGGRQTATPTSWRMRLDAVGRAGGTAQQSRNKWTAVVTAHWQSGTRPLAGGLCNRDGPGSMQEQRQGLWTGLPRQPCHAVLSAVGCGVAVAQTDGRPYHTKHRTHMAAPRQLCLQLLSPGRLQCASSTRRPTAPPRQCGSP